jgi:hypothetical protein
LLFHGVATQISYTFLYFGIGHISVITVTSTRLKINRFCNFVSFFLLGYLGQRY